MKFQLCVLAAVLVAGTQHVTSLNVNDCQKQATDQCSGLSGNDIQTKCSKKVLRKCFVEICVIKSKAYSKNNSCSFSEKKYQIENCHHELVQLQKNRECEHFSKYCKGLSTDQEYLKCLEARPSFCSPKNRGRFSFDCVEENVAEWICLDLTQEPDHQHCEKVIYTVLACYY